MIQQVLQRFGKSATDALVGAIVLAATGAIGSHLFLSGYSGRVVAVFVVTTVLVVWRLILAYTRRRAAAQGWPMRRSIVLIRRGLIIAIAVSITCFVWFLLLEPAGGSISIEPDRNSSSVPARLILQRGLARVEVTRDLQGRFVKPELRCGTWRVQPVPKEEYDAFEITIPTSGVRKGVFVRYFGKRLCPVQLTAVDAMTRESIIDAVVDIAPRPKTFGREILRTPAEGQVEQGIYSFTFIHPSYAPCEQPARTIAHGQRVVIECEMVLPSAAPVEPKPATQTSPVKETTPPVRTPTQRPVVQRVRPAPSPQIAPDMELERQVALSTSLKEVAVLRAQGKMTEAIEILERFRRNHPGTTEAEEARKLANELRAAESKEENPE